MPSLFKNAFALGWRVALPLDPGAFRFFLAMLVFIHHFSSFALGGYAVYVFFVLSGYWLQRMWDERYRRTRVPYFTYIVSRVWRLAPVMILINIVTIVLLPLVGVPEDKVFANSPLHLAFSSAFMLGYAWLDYLPVGSAWSLDVEMQFYVLAPLLSAILAATAIKSRTGWLLLVLFAAAAISIVFAPTKDAGEIADPASPLWAALKEVPSLPRYLVFFVAGMVATRIDWSAKGRWAAVSAGLFGLLVVGVFLSPWRGMLIVGGQPGPMAVWNSPFNVVLALITIPFAMYTTSRPSDGPDKMYADLSYILYLLHWVAMQWFFTFAGAPTRVRLAVAAASFALVPLGSWLIWRFYDKPLNRLRSRWVSSRMTGQPDPVARIERETAIN